MAVTLAPNPSHLEWVDPVVEGMVRAKQDAIGDDRSARCVLPILLHGDAAFAGQGIVAETLNLAGLEGYTTGGTIHVVINNQIGFTTSPTDARSSTYATDVAKMVQAPIFHVNGDDPEAVCARGRASPSSTAQRYKRDVVIDMFGYRRWGHNEGDEPSYTQPLMYAKIKNHTSVGAALRRAPRAHGRRSRARSWTASGRRRRRRCSARAKAGSLAQIARRAPVTPRAVDASAMWGRLRTTLQALSTGARRLRAPSQADAASSRSARSCWRARARSDWATAEALAWGTLLLEGVPVRLCGQDSGRGTFSQRHAVFYDVRTGKEYVAPAAPSPPRACASRCTTACSRKRR